MKKEKGVTLVSLAIYIILLILVAELVLLFNSNFFPQIVKLNSENTSAESFNKFSVSFVQDVKESRTAEVTNDSSNVIITLSNGVHYYYMADDDAIYREKIKIVDKVPTFSATSYSQSNKNIISITAVFGYDHDKSFGRTINYVLNYWS